MSVSQKCLSKTKEVNNTSGSRETQASGRGKTAVQKTWLRLTSKSVSIWSYLHFGRAMTACCQGTCVMFPRQRLDRCVWVSLPDRPAVLLPDYTRMSPCLRLGPGPCPSSLSFYRDGPWLPSSEAEILLSRHCHGPDPQCIQTRYVCGSWWMWRSIQLSQSVIVVNILMLVVPQWLTG